ncbi:MAG: hypothetical protein QG602_3193, partial [Verrucomicrobiota bacterium]|nr:hypothetical protein [Verrucomicrobiota bacterium]
MDLSTLFGRLHPLVLHFPIALLLLAAALELVRLKWDRPGLGRTVTLLMVVGAAGALMATATGWVFAVESHPRPSLRWMLQWHRWLGVATAVLASIAAWLAYRLSEAPNPGTRWLRRTAIWLTGLILIGAAHLGALMVWGEDYFDPSS